MRKLITNAKDDKEIWQKFANKTGESWIATDAYGKEIWRVKPMTDLYKLHERMTKHLFPTYSSEDERFLALALCGEAGELANMIKKRWRDSADLSEEIKDEIADVRVYTELLAKCFGIEGDKLDERVEQKLQKVVEKFQARLSKTDGV